MSEPTVQVPDTILFVDDEAKARKYFTLFFKGKHRVLAAADGEEALALFQSHRDEIAVVITDHIMPRMTGLDLLAQIGESGARITRILSTAYTDSDLVRAAVSDGLIDYFISKPWDLEKLEAIVGQSFSLLGHRLPIEEAC